MVVALVLLLEDHAGLLKDVGGVRGASDGAAPIEPDLNELAESRGIVVTQSLGIAPCLQDGAGLENFGLYASGGPGQEGQVAQTLLRGFRLSRTGLTTIATQ